MSATDSNPTITDTSYKRGSAADLVDYIEHDGTLKNRVGQEMADWERQQLIDRSEHHQFERHIVVSPHNAESLSDEALEDAVRETINQQFDGPSVDFAYSVHQDGGDRTHAHVVLVGTEQDLYMDRDDCDQLRERATQACQEHEQRLDQHLGHDLDHEHARDSPHPSQRWLDEQDISEGWRR